jgi:3-methyladenine DNA glycosylase/8-oxoguanine DNA glycosylase
MVKLSHSFEYEIEPIPPYSFELTVRKPAGWPLFTPFEVYENDTMWTATNLQSILVGIKLTSQGTTNQPRIKAEIFLKNEPKPDQSDEIKQSLVHNLSADGDLTEFYELARKDSMLKYAVEDLYGMKSTSSSTIFPDALLAILLQMTTFKRSDEMMSCLITKYGEIAEFDSQKVRVWPLPRSIAKHDSPELAKACNLGYRAKFIATKSKIFPSKLL